MQLQTSRNHLINTITQTTLMYDSYWEVEKIMVLSGT